MATITSAHQRAIANVYTALFNRAPDAVGFAFWTQALADGAPLSAITASFLGSPESTAIYTPSQSAADFVAAFYQTVFGRTPDAGGLAFWTAVLNGAGGANSTEGRALLVSKIIEIVGTSLPTKPVDLNDVQYADTVRDRELFAKKVVIGIDFAVNLKSNDLVAAKQALANADAPTTPAAPPTSVGDQTFALTVDADTLVGGAGNDTFTSAPGTLQTADLIDGGAGTDTLNIIASSNVPVAPTLKSIEVVKVTGQGDGAYITLATDSGVRNAGFVGSINASTIANVGDAALSVANQNANSFFYGSTATELVLTLDTVGIARIGSVVNVGTGGDAPLATSYAITASNSNVTIFGAGATGLNVTVAASGANSLNLFSGMAGKVARLAVTGTGSVDFSGASLSGLTNFDAAEGTRVTLTTTGTTALTANTGGGADTIVANGASIAVLNTGAGNDVVTLNTAALAAAARIDLGAGDDSLTLAVSPNAAAEIDGGLGEDTLNLTASLSGSTGPKLSNFEFVNVTAMAGSTSLNLADSAVTRVSLTRSTAASVVDNVGAAALSVSNQNAGASFNGSTAALLSLTLDTVGSAAAKVAVNIAATANAYDIVANNAHATVLDTNANMSNVTVRATGANSLNLSAAPSDVVTRLTVTGTGSVDFSGKALTALTSVEAGDGGITLVSTNANASVLDIKTGSAVDTITANGASIKTLNVGAGNDVITLNGGALAADASVDLGAGDDTLSLLVAPAAGARINGGVGTDTLSVSAAAYTAMANYDADSRALISGFDVLKITDVSASGTTIDMSKFAGVGSVVVGSGLIGNVAMTNLESNASVVFDLLASGASYQTMTAMFRENTSADVLNFRLSPNYVEDNNGVSSFVTHIYRVGTTGIETMNVVSTGTSSVPGVGPGQDGVYNRLELIDAYLENLVVTGDQRFGFVMDAQQQNLINIDASAVTADVVIAATVTTFARPMTIKGSLTGANQLSGGAGNDTMFGGAGADAMTGGGGNDIFNIASTASSRSAIFSDLTSDPSNIDRITDFAGNGAGAGDVIRLSVVGDSFGSGLTFNTSTTAVVTTVSVASAADFLALANAVQNATPGVASTNTVARIYDVTVAGGALEGRYVVVNNASAAISTGDTFISITGATGAVHASDFAFG